MKINRKKKTTKRMSAVIVCMLLSMTPLKVSATEMAVESAIENEVVPQEEMTEEETEINLVSDLDLGDYENRMTVGEKQLLSVTVLPLNASETTIIYSSSDTTVATINGMGRITALTLGTTTITITAGQISRSFELQVVEEKEPAISVTDIEIGDYESELEIGKTVTLSGTVLPSDATDSTITYTSSDTSIATVSSTGEVKGVSAGNVSITLTAGEISKTVTLTVKVATTGIILNNDYLVLKSGEAFQLSAKITPSDAPQAVTYKSVDTSVATVSAGGLVTGKGTGTTTIIVSNGDSSVAVSVIVNQAVNYERKEENVQGYNENEVVCEDIVSTSEQSVIDAKSLKYLYETKQIFKIVGDGYIIEIDGNDIVNYNNEFCTDIAMKQQDGILSFTLNKGNELCGAVTLLLEEPGGKYLYLYNDSKGSYERIETAKMDELKLTTAGEYQIRNTKLKSDMQFVLYVVTGGMALLLIGIVVYIIIKRRYWFW